MPKPPLPETHNRYAICIGINTSAPTAQISRELHCAEADALAVYDLLRVHGFAEEHCHLLLSEQATTQAIEQVLKTVLLSQAESDDLIVFYFAGHGLLINQPGKTDTCEVFLGSYDINRQRLDVDRGEWLEHPLRLGNVRERFFERTDSRKVLFLLDCCHSGDFFGPSYRGEESLAARYIAQPFATKSAGRVVLSSCLPQQYAYEDLQLGHGRFTAYLLEALRGNAPEAIEPDGWITVGSLFSYLSDRLPEKQCPVESGVKHGKFPLLYYPKYAHRDSQHAAQPTEEQQHTRKKLLQTLYIDHSGFIRSRLESFVGRERELEEVRQHIRALLTSGGYLTIAGEAGQGKSSIIARLVQEYGQKYVAHHFIPFNPGPDHQVSLLRDLMVQLILKHDLDDLYIAGESRPALRDYFVRLLSEIASRGDQEILFIDGLDQLRVDLDGERDLSFLPENPPEGIVFVVGTRPNDTLRPLELRKPHIPYRLPNMSRPDFDRILVHHHVQIEQGLADRFYHAMQENALYLDLVAKELSQKASLSPDALIQRIADDPENIFSLSVDRLKRQAMEWRELLKPLLGALLVAREPLSVHELRQILGLDSERVRDGLRRLGGLIADDGRNRYALFHLKLYEYLHQDERNLHKSFIFATDEEESWHQRLAAWCERGDITTIWEDNTYTTEQGRGEQERREYARQHYLAHLYFAREWPPLFAVLDEGHYGRAKLQVDPSTRRYAQDLDFGRKAAAWQEWTLSEGIDHLPFLWRYTLLRCSLASRADLYPLEAFGLLVLLKQQQKALGLAELLTNPGKKVRALLRIAEQLNRQESQQGAWQEVLIRANEIFHTIQDLDGQAEALRELADALMKAEQWQQAERIIARIEDAWLRTEALRELADALMKAEQWQQVEQMITRMEDVNEQAGALRELADMLVKAGQWQQAEQKILCIKDTWQQMEALRELSATLAQAKQSQQAERVIARIEDTDEQARALRELADVLAQAGELQQANVIWGKAKEIIALMEHAWQQAGALQELAASFVKVGQWQQADTIWTEVKEVIALIGDIDERALALRELSATLAQVGQWQQAEQVIARIEDTDEQARALRELAGALAQAKQWQQAEGTIFSIKDVRQRAIALGELAEALVKVGQWQRAEMMIASIENEDEQVETFWELDKTIAQPQQWQQAEMMIVSTENEDEHAKALREMIGAITQARQGEQAEALWAEAEKVIVHIRDISKRVELLRELADAFVKAEQWQRAEMLWLEIELVVTRMKYARQRVVAFGELAEALVKAGQWQRADTIWMKTEETIIRIEDLDARAKALGELAKAFHFSTQWQHAKAIILSIEDTRHQTEALEELAGALAQAKQWEQAEEVINQIEYAWQQASALRELAEALVKAGQWQRADRIWMKTEETIIRIEDLDARAETLQNLARALAQLGQWQRAEEVISQMEDVWLRAKALGELATALMKEGQWQRAEKMIARMENSWLRAEALRELADELIKVRQWPQAEEVISRMEDIDERAKALGELATALVKDEQWPRAVMIWVKAEEVIVRIKDIDARVKALRELVAAHIRAGQWPQAEEMISRMEDALQRAEALGELADGLMKAEQWPQAEEAISRMEDAWQRAGALRKLAANLAFTDTYEVLLRLIQHTCLLADTRDYAIEILPMISSLLPFKPEIGTAICEAFLWVDTFLKRS